MVPLALLARRLERPRKKESSLREHAQKLDRLASAFQRPRRVQRISIGSRGACFPGGHSEPRNVTAPGPSTGMRMRELTTPPPRRAIAIDRNFTSDELILRRRVRQRKRQ